jgi:hypothetical protein
MNPVLNIFIALKTSKVLRYAMGVSLVVVAVSFYWYGAETYLLEKNTSKDTIDQGAYMSITQMIYDRLHGTQYFFDKQYRLEQFPYTHDGARMWLYPFLQLQSFHPPMSDEDFFRVGKYFNVKFSLFLLAIVGVLLFRTLSPLVATNLLLIYAFTIFMPKAGAFQVELLYYAAFFICFLCMWRMLRYPSWKLAFGTGVALGITQYTKYAIMPGLFIYILVFGLQQVYGFFMINRKAAIHRFGMLVVTLLVFLLILSPNLYENKKKFGVYFYNVNSIFYMWYDSWNEIAQGTRAHDDRIGWPTMPEKDIPTFRKYVDEHGWRHVLLGRPRQGLSNTWALVTQSYGWQYYFLAFFVLSATLAIVRLPILRQYIGPQLFSIGFLMLFLGLYIGLTFWWVAAQQSMRFIMFLPMPLLYVLARFTDGLEPVRIQWAVKRMNIHTMFQCIMLACLIIQSYYLSTEGIRHLDGIS